MSIQSKQIRSGAMWLFCAGLLIGVSVTQGKIELLVGSLAVAAVFGVMGGMRIFKALRADNAEVRHEVQPASGSIGDALDQAIARVAAEMEAGRAVLATSAPLPDGVNRFDVMTGHLIEAADAFLEAAGAAGVDRKLVVLYAAAARHDIQFLACFKDHPSNADFAAERAPA